MAPDIFLSHSAKDKDLGQLLVNLLNEALEEQPSIRFTSVPEHGLSPAQDLMDLIDESVTAQVFVALITPDSLRSTPVLLEIGARLGSDKKIYRLLAAGARVSDLDKLLQRELVSECADQSQLRKLIEAISSCLGTTLGPPELYEVDLKALSNRSTELGTSRWKEKFVCEPLDLIANYDIEPDFANFPFGELRSSGGVLFKISPGKSVYQSANQKKTPFFTRLSLEQVVQDPRSAYFVINAGDAQSKQSGDTIGCIELEFSDSTMQPCDLVLGKNIFEWAVNNPGNLVTKPVGSGQVVRIYSGPNTSGNDSRLDVLEIPILRQNREKTLAAITFSQDHSSRAKFFVCAITIEKSDET